ncbi:glycosyltransferase [Photobacterium carnosum]|uniref:glycosyltransferase n=1 Tax=Photobacterium carnosum TaxID=2023717 RepID=UPI001E28E604|nr:glycosyltransferase [Photobacterium carnosum]MCD9493508.1 glycosyltransferase [Photobacterium carnosum]
MKVALFIPDFSQGGAESVVANLANYIVKNTGFDVDLIVTNKNGTLINIIDSRVSIINLNCKNVRFSLLKLCLYLMKNRPNILLSTLKENNIMVVIANRLTLNKTKIILREANTLSSEFCNEGDRFVGIIKKYLVKLTYPMSDHIIALSNHMRDDILSVLNVNRNDISVIYNPVNIEHINYKANEINNPYDDNVFNILSVARLYKAKGYETILKSLSMLKNSGIDFRFHSLGHGPELDFLKKYAKELNIDKNVTFWGFRENPYPFIKNSNCFVLASEMEGMPNSLLQAMSLNIPVIATDSPGAVSEVTEGGLYGKLFSVGDYKKLYEILYDNYKLYKDNQLNINTKDFIHTRHNESLIMDKYIDVFVNIEKK